MSTFWIVLNVISAIILVAYFAYGIMKKKRIKELKAAEALKPMQKNISEKENQTL